MVGYPAGNREGVSRRAYDEQVFGGHQRVALARCVRRGANGYDGPVVHHRTGERPVKEGGQIFAPANRWVTEDDAEEK